MIVSGLIHPHLSISEWQFPTERTHCDYLQNDIKADCYEEGNEESEGRDEDVVPQPQGEVGLALETETEDREEAEDQATDDHGLVILEIPDCQHRHHEGGEDLADSVLVHQAHRGEAEEDKDLDEKNELWELPEDGEEETGAVDGDQETPPAPAGRIVGLHSQELSGQQELEEDEGQWEMFP